MFDLQLIKGLGHLKASKTSAAQRGVPSQSAHGLGSQRLSNVLIL